MNVKEVWVHGLAFLTLQCRALTQITEFGNYSMTEVDVIIPVFNTPLRFLTEALDSLRGQTTRAGLRGSLTMAPIRNIH